MFPGLVGNKGKNFSLYAFKLTRFVHTYRLFKLFGTIMNKFLLSRGYNVMKVRDYVDLVTLFLFVFFATHLLACFWCYLGRLDYYLPIDEKYSWVNLGSFIVETDFKTIYIFSVYFILQTLTTVGYGDHTGSTRYEHIFCMILEVGTIQIVLIPTLVHWFEFLLFPDGKHQQHVEKVRQL